MKTKIILSVMVAMFFSGCSGAHKIKDHKADVSYAKSADLGSAKRLTSAEEDSAMFPVAQLPKQSVVAPSILPPGSLKQQLHQLAVDSSPASQATGDLLVKYDLGKAWDKLAVALEKGGLRLLAQDEKLGVFYVWHKGEGEASSQVYQVKLQKQDKHNTRVLLTDERNRALPPSELKRIEAIVAMLNG